MKERDETNGKDFKMMKRQSVTKRSVLMKRERFASVKYYKFEIHPCVLLDDKNNTVRNDDPTGKYYEQCEEDDPNLAVWTVYGHIPAVGAESISDHSTKYDAEKAMAAIIKDALGNAVSGE